MGCQDGQRNKAPSVPSPPVHDPWHGAQAKIDRLSSSAFETHGFDDLDVAFYSG
jgi:hypothetical protein